MQLTARSEVINSAQASNKPLACWPDQCNGEVCVQSGNMSDRHQKENYASWNNAHKASSQSLMRGAAVAVSLGTETCAHCSLKTFCVDGLDNFANVEEK